MTDYEQLVLQARRKTLKLTQRQHREILKIYRQAIRNLQDKAKKAKGKSLTERWAKDYLKQVEIEAERLNNAIAGVMKENLLQAGNYAVQPDIKLFKKALQKAGIDLGDHFTEMFSQVPSDVLTVMFKGDLYKDGRGLSSRIWDISSQLGRDIDYIIHQAIAEKKSAIELAKDLEQFVKPEAQRPGTWGTCYPKLRTKQMDYNAQRLARTSITHAHREAQYRSAARNPFVEAVHWETSREHFNRQVKKWGEDICDQYERQDKYGLGPGNYPPSKVPIGHPQCLCHTYPVIPKSLDEVADELKAWLDGNNPKLNKKLGKAPKSQPKVETPLDKLVNRVKKVKGMDTNDMGKIGFEILKELELDHIPVYTMPIQDNGYCRVDVDNDIAKILEYVLDLSDKRNGNYRIKTAFHEAFHAKGDGRKTTFHKDTTAWLQIEETFAETSAHYMVKAIGIHEEISASYCEKLVEMLPRLKQLPKFKDCKTFADFGRIAWEERLAGGTAQWTTLYNQAMKQSHDWKVYAQQYFQYIDDHTDELLDVMLNSMPECRKYKSNMASDYKYAKAKMLANSNIRLTSNENVVMTNLVALAMNRLGVK